MFVTKIDETHFDVNEYTLWDIKLNIYMQKTKFTPRNQYFFGLLLSRNVKKPHTDQSILQVFYSVWKETNQKP